VRATVRGALKNYLHFAAAEDWRAMAESRASLRQLPRGLTDALKALIAFSPATPGQQIAQRRAVGAIEQASQARRDRILLSQASISPLQWIVILVLAMTVLVTIAMVHIDRRLTAAVNLFLFSTAVAACLVLLMVYDRPFTTGGNTLEPRALQEIEFD
jgi:hypothetical protein